jgi:hypothetical protein
MSALGGLRAKVMRRGVIPLRGSFGRWAEKANFPEADASTVRGNSIDGTIARVDKP